MPWIWGGAGWFRKIKKCSSLTNGHMNLWSWPAQLCNQKSHVYQGRDG